ncbi:MAG: hypothetical protein CMJ18_13755 [Phycisphaeraceae bacterium]|nr:hypothetical protein [Phycisphaeraceae bacterium]
MQTLRDAALFAALLTIVGTVSARAGIMQVPYEVRFDATWSAATHPGAYPGGAHFSPLVGTTHNDNVRFWEPGGIATPGIERMAETGSTFTLRNEFLAEGNDVDTQILGSTIGSPSSTTLAFDVDASHPLVTLVTMIAPSPDWFVGVHDLNLRHGNLWRHFVQVDLFAYDSGTDSGPNFTSQNADVAPHVPITLISGAPFDGRPRLGTFTFRLVPEPSTIGGVVGAAAFCRFGRRGARSADRAGAGRSQWSNSPNK